MDATAPPTDAPLPTDVTTLQAMVRELLARVQQLEARNAALKHRFGRRSERRPAPDKSADKPPPQRDPHGRSPHIWNGVRSFTT